MNFDVRELNKRPYQVLSTLYHLHRFFMQNAEYDNFDPKVHTLEWAKKNNTLKPADLWLLSRLQKTVESYTRKLEKCEFNLAVAELEDFVVDIVSRQYVPMVRRDLWSDDPKTLQRRLTVYVTLWQTLRTLVLLFNPATPFLSEFLHQKVYRELDDSLPESVNFEKWPLPEEVLRDTELEQAFDTLQRCVALVYSARQSAQLKRRWPLQKAVIVAPKQVLEAVKSLEDVFLELANVKQVEYISERVAFDEKEWASAREGNLQILLNTRRDEALLGEGLMRDLARRVQSLRKERGFMPTDILEAVHLAELDQESIKLVEPYLTEMAELVRTKKVYLHKKRAEVEAEWREYLLDNKKVFIAIF
jgi:isoleucyl-tRNA synthetase